MSNTRPDSSQVVFVPSGVGAVATTVQAKLRESVSVLDFGAISGGTAAANTVAIQAAIDYAAPLGKSVFIPAGTYSITVLTIPPQHGGVEIYGEAYNSIYNLSIGTYVGTNLVSTTTTGNVISCDGGAFYSNRGIRIGNLSISATTSGNLIHLVGSPELTQLTNITGYQQGTGCGFYIKDCWSGLSIDGCHLNGALAGSTGITVINTISAGQYYIGNGTQVNNFDTGIALGTSLTTIYNVLIENTAIQQTRLTGISLGAVHTVVITNTHFEFNTGPSISKSAFGAATSVNIESNSFYRNGTTKDIGISNSTYYADGWSICNNNFAGISDGVTAISSSNAAFNSGVISNNYFIGYAGTTVGINLGAVAGPNWTVSNNQFSSVTTPVVNSTLIGLYIQNSGIYSAITTTQVKTANGALVAVPTATPTTIFNATAKGVYQVYAYYLGASAAAYSASAVVHSTEGNVKITATNGTNMTLTASGTNIQVTHTVGSNIDLPYVYLKIA